MILGLSVETFTLIHVVISLIGIAAGIAVLFGLIGGKPLGLLNTIFLVTTIATSATGFFFHSKAIGPPHVVGVISLVVLALALWALYGAHLAGIWRSVYVVSAVFALYLNCFVGVVQSFQKVAVLHPLAPTGKEPPFLIAQAATLLAFVLLGFLAVRRRPAPLAA
jgi:hypothetical protein